MSHRIASGALVLALVFAGAASAAELPGAFRGNAYGSFGNEKAGALATSLSRSAYQPCPCEGTNGQTLTSEVDNLSAPGLLSAGSTVSTAYTKKTASTAEVTNTSTVSGLNMLGGLITAGSIVASTTVDATATTMTPSTAGSSFNNVVIAGQTVPGDVSPNTVMDLPGIGTVTLNAVTQKGQFDNWGSVSVDMMTIQVTKANNFGLKTGARFVIAHAQAGYKRHEPDVVYGGQAYAALTSGAAGDQLANEIGQGASLRVGCEGTNGKTRTNSVKAIKAPGIFTMGDAISTAFAGPEGGRQVSRTTSHVSRINLLGGMIKADGIDAVAQSTDIDGDVTGSADGSGFSGLTVAGVQVPANTPPNTRIDLPLIGSVVVNEQTVKKDGSVSVNGLHVTVSNANLLGLPVGTELTVAHAEAAVAPF